MRILWLAAICSVLTLSQAEAAVYLRCQSSITGKFVSIAYAKMHPDTTWCKFIRKG